MDDNFRHWRETPDSTEDNCLVISDSDEDVQDNTERDKIFVVESNESSLNVSTNVTSESSRHSTRAKLSLVEKAIKQRIKKDIRGNSDSEENSNQDEDSIVLPSDSEEDDTDGYVSNADETEQVVERIDKVNEKVQLENVVEGKIDDSQWEESHENSNSSAESELALSFAKQEIGVGNIDPLVAQRRALLVCKMEQLQNQLRKTELLLTTGNIDLLPDKGEKLRKSIDMQEKEINEIAMELKNTPLTHAVKTERPFTATGEVSSIKEEISEQERSYSNSLDSYSNLDRAPTIPNSFSESKELGIQAQATLSKELALTVDRLQDLHGSLLARPTEEQRAEDPQGLKVKLMPHQQHALAWLMWREQQRPPGGVLADDMGLGKTLTMISLIIASNANKALKEDAEESSDEEWTDSNTLLRHKGGTLVVCPASLLSQWENEINNRCKRGMLAVEVYHGTNRESVPKRLAKNDVVITTYNILSREFKTRSTTYRIQWQRVILDEAHIIRNHKSQASQAACGLVTRKRWALTGTPIQNKELDLYSILKFLKCSPFDDLRVWKRWVDNKNAAGRQRLATLMKTLMLRRTKQELQAKGDLESLPEKFIEEILVQLDSQEQLVYEKVLIYSRTLFAQFLSQRADKDHLTDLAGGMYDKPTFLSNPNKNTQFTKAQNRLLSLHADVKTHEILVLLLRLRQICVHPSLIHSMLDHEDIRETGVVDTENFDPTLLQKINNITLHDSEDNEAETDEKEIGVDHRVTTNLLTSKNPVFNSDRISSKMRMVLSKVEEILEMNDKMIIVSQWTSMLEIVASNISSIKGASFSMFTGNVPIKERQGIMDSFNNRNTDPKILLLSLTAGGVGLNLVGGNHLLLIDIHWNPQLEVQAQDRIYRFGQDKNVYIYKFICKETIEERIKHLQERKLDVAQNVLSGDKNSAASKLTFNDLKSLFAL